MNDDDLDLYATEGTARGLTGTEWSRLSWLMGGVGLIVGFGAGILVCTGLS